MPKMNAKELRELTKNFLTLLHLHVSQISTNKPMERVLIENSQHLFTEKIKSVVNGELTGLKGDVKHSKGLSSKVGELLSSARGYFNKVKDVKNKLDNPVGAVGSLIKGKIGGAFDGLSSLKFRELTGSGNIF